MLIHKLGEYAIEVELIEAATFHLDIFPLWALIPAGSVSGPSSTSIPSIPLLMVPYS